MAEKLLVLKNVSKTFPVPDHDTDLTVLNGLNLELGTGEMISIVGPSGSGKSTLLNIMGILDEVTSGSVEFNGRNISELSEKQRAQIRAGEIGFIFQLHHLLPQFTVLENVLLPILALERREGDSEKRALELLDKVGLSERAYYTPSRLSGGEAQRVAVVRALINSPGLILADEPTGSLDHDNAVSLVKLLKDLVGQTDASIVMVTHSTELARESGKVFELKNGKLETQ